MVTDDGPESSQVCCWRSQPQSSFLPETIHSVAPSSMGENESIITPNIPVWVMDCSSYTTGKKCIKVKWHFKITLQEKSDFNFLDHPANHLIQMQLWLSRGKGFPLLGWKHCLQNYELSPVDVVLLLGPPEREKEPSDLRIVTSGQVSTAG